MSIRILLDSNDGKPSITDFVNGKFIDSHKLSSLGVGAMESGLCQIISVHPSRSSCSPALCLRCLHRLGHISWLQQPLASIGHGKQEMTTQVWRQTTKKSQGIYCPESLPARLPQSGSILQSMVTLCLKVTISPWPMPVGSSNYSFPHPFEPWGGNSSTVTVPRSLWYFCTE